jgi:transcriptional regulator with XRE-family HTH domain
MTLSMRNKANHYSPNSTVMTKADIARKLGVSRTYITLLTQGKRKPSKELANKLAKLKLTVDIKCNQQTGGPLAQLAEHLTFNQGVTGSRPVRPTKAGKPSLPGIFVENQGVKTLGQPTP